MEDYQLILDWTRCTHTRASGPYWAEAQTLPPSVPCWPALTLPRRQACWSLVDSNDYVSDCRLSTVTAVWWSTNPTTPRQWVSCSSWTILKISVTFVHLTDTFTQSDLQEGEESLGRSLGIEHRTLRWQGKRAKHYTTEPRNSQPSPVTVSRAAGNLLMWAWDGYMPREGIRPLPSKSADICSRWVSLIC